MSKAKELVESLKGLPENMLPKAEEPKEFSESEVEGVELTEDEDKNYHVKKEKNQHGEEVHNVYHNDTHVGTVKKVGDSHLMWVKKDGKMRGGDKVGSVEHGVSVVKKLHKKSLA